jgi:hypothetical protein
MPNRIIKDSIRTSKSINAMSDFQFRLWAYLITYVDDYGRGSADPELLKGFVFPRRKGVTEGTISKTLAELATIGSVILYEVDGEPYLCFPNWSEHQTVRNKVSKFPAPADGLITSEINCNQLQAGESKCARNPIQNPESRIQNPEEVGGEPQTASPPVVSIPLNDGTEYPVSQEQCQEWAGVYPAVDVIQQLREMREWCLNNPAKRKTARGVRGFITRWLAKEQDRGGRKGAKGPGSKCEDAWGYV